MYPRESQELLSRRTLPWNRRPRITPLPLGRRPQGSGMVPRQIQFEPPYGSGDVAAQSESRLAPHSFTSAHNMTNMMAAADDVSNEIARIHQTLGHITAHIDSLNRSLGEFWEDRKESNEKMQEIRNMVETLMDMYPVAGQDTVDPNITFPPLPSA